jgi:hypothetical protein
VGCILFHAQVILLEGIPLTVFPVQVDPQLGKGKKITEKEQVRVMTSGSTLHLALRS